MARKVIVVGGTAAGLSAASKAKRLDPELEIIVFEKSGYISYGSCGLPYFVGDMIKDPDDLVSLHVNDMRDKRGIPVFIHHEVTHVDSSAKKIQVKNLDDGSEQTYQYDDLVLATGASPIKPIVPGVDSDGVYFLRTVEDGVRLKGAVRKGMSAAIVGGGFIGLEVAEELTAQGVKVHVFEALPRLLPVLPESYSQMVLETLETNGVTVHLGEPVMALASSEGKVCGITTASGTVECSMVLMSIGVVPNNALAKEAGLELGIKGSIVVDNRMRTSDPSIWACGDCAQTENSITGQSAYIPLGTTANKMGRVAGSNIGGEDSSFHGVLGSQVTKVFDLYIAATGLNLKQAIDAGFAAVESQVVKGDKASYYPSAKPMYLNFILDSSTGRLLGAQSLGSEASAIRMDALAVAVDAGMTVSRINDLDLIYAPPVAPVYDPILIAASQAMKKVRS